MCVGGGGSWERREGRGQRTSRSGKRQVGGPIAGCQDHVSPPTARAGDVKEIFGRVAGQPKALGPLITGLLLFLRGSFAPWLAAKVGLLLLLHAARTYETDGWASAFANAVYLTAHGAPLHADFAACMRTHLESTDGHGCMFAPCPTRPATRRRTPPPCRPAGRRRAPRCRRSLRGGRGGRAAAPRACRGEGARGGGHRRGRGNVRQAARATPARRGGAGGSWCGCRGAWNR